MGLRGHDLDLDLCSEFLMIAAYQGSRINLERPLALNYGLFCSFAYLIEADDIVLPCIRRLF